MPIEGAGSCTANVISAKSADQWKRRLKVASIQRMSCLLTLKPQSLSPKVLPDDDNICIPQRQLKIVYEQIIKLWVSASNHINRDQTLQKSSQTWVHDIIER